MKNLLITVSAEPSTTLFSEYADVIILDKDPLGTPVGSYDTAYIRSHFSHPDMMPQRFKDEINTIVKQLRSANPSIVFIDGMDDVDAIVAFEDKWNEYQTLREFMPRTEPISQAWNISHFHRPIFKRRLSSRGTGIAWSATEITGDPADWIVQESISICEELRIYVIKGEVYPIGAIRQSSTPMSNVTPIGSRALSSDEIEFSLKVAGAISSIDMVGLDIARAHDGALHLIEVNRSPGFLKFFDLTGINLASILYAS